MKEDMFYIFADAAWRNAIFYGLTYFCVSTIVFIIANCLFSGRKIQNKNAYAADLYREIFSSLSTILVFSIFAGAMGYGFSTGFYSEPEEGGVIVWMFYLTIVILTHDAYFYWTHRLMHLRSLFGSFHRHHHRSRTPTAFAAFAFAVPEAVVHAMFMPIWQLLLPTPVGVIIVFQILQLARNSIQHSGFEWHPRWWTDNTATAWIATTTHHDIHHGVDYTKNFGFYFRIWDRLMGTEHVDYEARFREVTAARLH